MNLLAIVIGLSAAVHSKLLLSSREMFVLFVRQAQVTGHRKNYAISGASALGIHSQMMTSMYMLQPFGENQTVAIREIGR